MVRPQTSIPVQKSVQTLRAAFFGPSLELAIVTSGVRIRDVRSGGASCQAKNHAIEQKRSRLNVSVALMSFASCNEIMNIDYNNHNDSDYKNMKTLEAMQCMMRQSILR